MANPTITNVDIGGVILKDAQFRDDVLAFAAADIAAEGTILARKKVVTAIVAAANGGNAGDGTVTLAAVVAGSKVPLVGAYVLECVEVGGMGVVVGSSDPDGGNTGNGLITAYAVASGGSPKVGNHILQCTDANAGGGKTGSGAFSGTGNGTIGTITPSTEAIEGDYIATCINASSSGSEIFEVIDPNGDMLETLTVAVAYANAHLGVTINDGSTDFIVGDEWTITVTIAHGGKFKLTDPDGIDLLEDITLPGTTLGTITVSSGGIDFTINDGSTDFAVDDFFTLVISATESGGGVFKLEDPNGALVASGLIMTGGAGVATVFEAEGMTFKITDGATDFAVGDLFTLTVSADGNLGYFVSTGLGGLQIPTHILTYEIVVTGSGDVQIRPMMSGTVRKERLVIDADGDSSNVDNTVIDQLRHVGIFVKNVTELNVLDNA